VFERAQDSADGRWPPLLAALRGEDLIFVEAGRYRSERPTLIVLALDTLHNAAWKLTGTAKANSLSTFHRQRILRPLRNEASLELSERR
jgi:hypothetical protein